MRKEYYKPYFTNGIGWTVCENQFDYKGLTGFVNHRFQNESEALQFWAEKEMEKLKAKGWTKQDFAKALKMELV